MRLQDSITVRIDLADKGLERVGGGLSTLGIYHGRLIMSDALNKAGDLARTQVRRTISKETALPYGRIVAETRSTRSNPLKLTYRIDARGRPTSLSEFKPRETARGVSAAPWGQRRIFPGTFIVDSRGGDVFKRQTPSRFPITRLWGPIVPKEMVREKPVAEFEKVAARLAEQLPRQLARDLKL